DLCTTIDQNFVFLRGFFRERLCLLINRPRARRRARAREAINPIQSWIVGMTAKGAAIHRTTRCHVVGRRYFAEPPLDGLKPGSPTDRQARICRTNRTLPRRRSGLPSSKSAGNANTRLAMLSTHLFALKLRRHIPTSVLTVFKTTLSTVDLRR